MMEDLAGVAVDVEYSSEYSYRSTHAGADPIVIVITQSGETADTIAAQREALNRGARNGGHFERRRLDDRARGDGRAAHLRGPGKSHSRHKKFHCTTRDSLPVSRCFSRGGAAA